MRRRPTSEIDIVAGWGDYFSQGVPAYRWRAKVFGAKNWARKLLITCLRRAPKKGKKRHFATACFPDTIFLSNSTQVLIKFLSSFTSVEDGQILLITFSGDGPERPFCGCFF